MKECLNIQIFFFFLLVFFVELHNIYPFSLKLDSIKDNFYCKNLGEKKKLLYLENMFSFLKDDARRFDVSTFCAIFTKIN